MDRLPTDHDRLLFINERPGDLRVVPVLLGHAGKIIGVIGNILVLQRLGEVLPACHHGSRRADGADGSHVNFLRRNGDQRPSRTGVRVDVSERAHLDLGEGLLHLHAGFEFAAVGVHIEDDRLRLIALGLFERPAQEKELGLRDLPFKRNHEHLRSRCGRDSAAQRTKNHCHRKNPAKQSVHICGDFRCFHPAAQADSGVIWGKKQKNYSITHILLESALELFRKEGKTLPLYETSIPRYGFCRRYTHRLRTQDHDRRYRHQGRQGSC